MLFLLLVLPLVTAKSPFVIGNSTPPSSAYKVMTLDDVKSPDFLEYHNAGRLEHLSVNRVQCCLFSVKEGYLKIGDRYVIPYTTSGKHQCIPLVSHVKFGTYTSGDWKYVGNLTASHVKQLQYGEAHSDCNRDKPETFALYRIKSIIVEVTGRTNGSVWGTDVYTSLSDKATAAVHAGKVAKDQRAEITVEELEARSSFNGTTRNGVTSRSHGADAKPYRIAAVKVLPPLWWLPFLALGPMPRPGTLDIAVNGSIHGLVCGTANYTVGSDLGAAAVHAGAMSSGGSGKVTVEVALGLRRYTGSMQHGVNSTSCGPSPYTLRFHAHKGIGALLRALQRWGLYSYLLSIATGLVAAVLL